MMGLKSILPRGLFARSLIILITPLIIVQVVTAFIFFDNHWARMTSRLGYAAAGEIALVAQFIEESKDESTAQNVQRSAFRHLDFKVSYDKNAAFAGQENAHDATQLWEYAVAYIFKKELRQSLRRPFNLRVDFSEKWIYVDVDLKKGVLSVALPQRRLFASSGYIVLLWMLGSSVLLLLIAVLFMRNQIRPIRKLAIAADRFGKGGDLVSFKPSGAKEVRQAAEAILAMQQRIRRQIEQRTAMLAGVSHDLRTPLTRLKLQLEILGDNDDTRAMKNDIQDMEHMISGYLDFARGADGEQTSFTNLSELLHKISTDFSKTKTGVNFDIVDGVYMMLRPVSIGRCVSNILNNAAQYGEQVWLRLTKDDVNVLIEIEDDGPGLNAAQYEDVFKPFFRSDKARDTEEGHVGLGLSIALGIVHTHGGQIVLDKSEQGGLLVRIYLPT